MLSTKYLVFKRRLVKKLVDWYNGLYIIEEIVSTNTVKLQLFTSVRIHPVMNISQILQYREQIGRAESRRSETGKSRESWGVESGKNIQ